MIYINILAVYNLWRCRRACAQAVGENGSVGNGLGGAAHDFDKALLAPFGAKGVQAEPIVQIAIRVVAIADYHQELRAAGFGPHWRHIDTAAVVHEAKGRGIVFHNHWNLAGYVAHKQIIVAIFYGAIGVQFDAARCQLGHAHALMIQRIVSCIFILVQQNSVCLGQIVEGRLWHLRGAASAHASTIDQCLGGVVQRQHFYSLYGIQYLNGRGRRIGPAAAADGALIPCRHIDPKFG